MKIGRVVISDTPVLAKPLQDTDWFKKKYTRCHVPANRLVYPVNGRDSPRFNAMMNVLIIGDEQSYGGRLRAGQLSYAGHFVRQVSRTGQSIQVEIYTPPTACCVVNTLNQLALHQYDLILVQTERMADAPDNTLSWPKLAGPFLAGPNRMPVPLTELLIRLRPFRHTVVLLTPLPHQNRAVRQRRNRLRTLLMRQARRQAFSLFDTSALLAPRPEYFLADDSSLLNATSHELLGQSLYAFYQSAPAIVTVQPIRSR